MKYRSLILLLTLVLALSFTGCGLPTPRAAVTDAPYDTLVKIKAGVEADLYLDQDQHVIRTEYTPDSLSSQTDLTGKDADKAVEELLPVLAAQPSADLGAVSIDLAESKQSEDAQAELLRRVYHSFKDQAEAKEWSPAVSLLLLGNNVEKIGRAHV